MRECVRRVGPRPSGLTRQGALAELLAKRSYSGEKVAVADLDVRLLSLPEGGHPVAIETLMCSKGSEMVETFLRDKVLSIGQAEERRRESRVKQPYMDPGLRRQPRRYAALLRRMDDANMLCWRRQGTPPRGGSSRCGRRMGASG